MNGGGAGRPLNCQLYNTLNVNAMSRLFYALTKFLRSWLFSAKNGRCSEPSSQPAVVHAPTFYLKIRHFSSHPLRGIFFLSLSTLFGAMETSNPHYTSTFISKGWQPPQTRHETIQQAAENFELSVDPRLKGMTVITQPGDCQSVLPSQDHQERQPTTGKEYEGFHNAFPLETSAPPQVEPQEDWTKISDLVERRRIQNRISQRTYRR